MEKKIWTINVHYDVCFSYAIKAESEEEAQEIAEDLAKNEDGGNAEWDFIESCTCDEFTLEEAEREGIRTDNEDED